MLSQVEEYIKLMNNMRQQINQVFFIFNTREFHSVNRKGLRAFTLVGLPRANQELYPLAVLHLDNQLHMLLQWKLPLIPNENERMVTC